MSVNKHALIRYQALDRCFRNSGRMYFWEDLLAECNKALSEYSLGSVGIQRRQLFDDIRFMESDQGWSVSLERRRYGKKVYYRYTDTSFSISNEPINASEAEQLKSALQIISRFSGTPQFEWVNEMIPMLESKLGLLGRKGEAISFQSNVDLKGLHLLPAIFNAIVNERVIVANYQDFKNPESYEVTLHPYYLKQYNNRWFVFGLNELHGVSTWNLALDRILAIKETDKQYRQCEIDWEEYFFDLVGVTKPQSGTIQDVVIRFSDSIAPYILTKPLHPSQKNNRIDARLEVTIRVIPNLELETLILSFGEHAVVTSPAELRDRIADRAGLAKLQYDS